MAELTPQAFAKKWQGSSLKERSAAQEHFIDLCRMLGHGTPAEMDPKGTHFTFEKGAEKRDGSDGWADVWFKGHFAWEYKGKHADMAAAYDQLLQYREDLDSPPLLIVCDTDRFEVHCNFTGSAKRAYAFSLQTLAEDGEATIVPPTPGAKAPSAMHVLRAAFGDPPSLRPQEESDFVTQAVAGYIGSVSNELRLRKIDPAEAAHFLMKVLFCFFAEDIGLLPGRIFQTLLEKTRTDSDLFARYARELFRAMSRGGHVLLERIPHFDGGLFKDEAVVRLLPNEIDILYEAAKWDWSSVEPSIFGTLFERCLDPDKQTQIGRHYTYAKDIADIVEPVLVAPLQEEWNALAGDIEKLDPRKQAARIEKLLRGFQDRLASVRVLDPACGSGNFLYVAMRRLLDLEKKVVNLAARRGIDLQFKVRPTQLHGMEINRFAHELASVVVWIGYLQWMRDNGAPKPKEPILEPIETIRLMDAIVDRGGKDGKPREPEWAEGDFIIGNPPFLGGKKLRSELGDEYVDAMFAVWGNRVQREADLCCYWFEKARELVEAESKKHHQVRVGLLATQGIRGGANRKVLERIKETGDIFMAWSDRAWILDGAAVRVSMVGFDDGSQKARTLDGKPAATINADLSCRADITKARRLAENLGISFMGDTKVGPFDIPGDLARQMLGQPNPTGKPNSDVVRPWMNGLDVSRRPRDIWIVDFPPGTSEQDAALYEAPFEYIKDHVKPFRKDAKSGDCTGVPWWIHQRPRPDMRAALAPLSRYLVVPRIAKHSLFAWVPGHLLADCQLIVFARQDDYFFGVLQSRIHAVWSDAKGTQLREKESGRRYTPTTCFETFPFPWPANLGEPPADRRAVHARISAAAARLHELRDGWLNPERGSLPPKERARRTLTNLYNKRPTWLADAHAELDAAVLDAYGWPADISDDDLLDRLLALNLSRPAAE